MADSGDEGWVPRYRAQGYRNMFEDGLHPTFNQWVSIAYGEKDQEAPFLAVGHCTPLTITSVGYDAITLVFTLTSASVEHEFTFHLGWAEVLWRAT